MDLKEIRKRIDAIDDAMLYLLTKRMEEALRANRFKTGVEDSLREREIWERMRSRATGVIGEAFVEDLFHQIVGESKRLQHENRSLIAFQGEHGAYGEMASQAWNSRPIPMPCRTFGEVVGGVASGCYDQGIVPVENTLGGSIDQVNRLLLKADLFVVGAVRLPVRHCLLALPDTDHREIRHVYSHPQALSQCRRFLERNHLEPVPYEDTAGAAKMLSETKVKGAAAIASRLCARLYHLDILKEGIQDMERNTTRFLVLSRERVPAEGDKCSVMFTTEHKAGTLFRVLQAFAENAINLTRIESIPNEPGDYAFFLDFEGSDRDRIVADVLAAVERMTTRFRLLGCYIERRIQ